MEKIGTDYKRCVACVRSSLVWRKHKPAKHSRIPEKHLEASRTWYPSVPYKHREEETLLLLTSCLCLRFCFCYSGMHLLQDARVVFLSNSYIREQAIQYNTLFPNIPLQWALCISPKSVQKVIFCFKTSLELLTLVTAFPFSFASLSKIENTFIIK